MDGDARGFEQLRVLVVLDAVRERDLAQPADAVGTDLAPEDALVDVEVVEIVELGDAEQITSSPRHEYTKTLLAATPEVEAF